MRPDDNWKEVRILAEDLEALTGVPTRTTEDFLTIIENLVVHKLAEMISTDLDNLDKDYAVELPYLGTMVVSTTSQGKVDSVDFVPRPAMSRKIRDAVRSGTSPLVKQLGDILGQEYVRKLEEGVIDE